MRLSLAEPLCPRQLLRHLIFGLGQIRAAFLPPKSKTFLTISLGAISILNGFENANAGPSESEAATRIFSRLAAYKLSLSDPRRSQMESLIASGQLLQAAQIATQDDAFYNVTVRHFAAPMSNRMGLIDVELNDFIAMIIGNTRDNRDARDLLSGDFIYIGNSNASGYSSLCNKASTKDCVYDTNFVNDHFKAMGSSKINLRQFLLRLDKQSPYVSDAAGLLTSTTWGENHLIAGTNRRAVEFAMSQFLCAPIDSLRDGTLSADRIRRDVDRVPSGDAALFDTRCKTCHSGMDGLAGAFAFFNYNPDDSKILKQFSTVVAKYNQNNEVFPTGFKTTNNSWVNYWTQGTNASLGWRGERSGNGVKSFGRMLANSQAFSQCMVKRVYRSVCQRDLGSAENLAVVEWAHQFEDSSYNLKTLFETVAIAPSCLGR